MTINIIKLCVGISEIEELAAAQDFRLDTTGMLFHKTRMMPKRLDELLDGGSLYWVIKGSVQARQLITDVVPFVDEDGIKRCRFMLHKNLIATRPQPRRPFQGWRYLKPEDAPRDLDMSSSAEQDLPAAMRAELVELGLL